MISTAGTAGWVRALTDLEQLWDSVRAGAGLPSRVPPVAEWSKVLIELEAVRDAIVASGGWTAGPSNLMDVLGLSRAEVANSRVVRWLFDPAARHGLGAQLLERLAARYDLRAADLTTCRVEAEVSRDQSRADLVCTGFTVGSLVIEAKVDAGEGRDQGRRLEEDWPEAARFVFLTTTGDKTPTTAKDTKRWSSLSWAWIADAVESVLDQAPELPDDRTREARHAAREWALAARRHLA